MNWEPAIGLEVHVQLDTASKIFSGASTCFGATPNTQACAVDLALPGTLPTLNEQAVLMALRFGLSIGAKIAEETVFYRKNYFYPDLPKGYQISQLGQPIVGIGSIDLGDGSGRKLAIERAHLEEDAGKSMHENIQDATGIDLNRAGVPLLEIVTAPEISSATEAGAWLRRIHRLVYYLGICNGIMAEGSLRCDANVSVKPAGQKELGERAEIKNINSFRFVEQAIEFEINRQTLSLEQGQPIVRETRLYDSDQHQTRSMRSKEYAEDYRYFPEPDLLPLTIDAKLIESIRQSLPLLPDIRSAHYQSKHGLSQKTADYLCQDCFTADYFDAVVDQCGDATTSANWIMGELASANNVAAITIANTPVLSKSLAALINRINDSTLSSKMAKTVFQALYDNSEDNVDTIIDLLGLKQMSNENELRTLVADVVNQHPHQANQYRAGKTKLQGFFIGQIMQATQGQADPVKVNELLLKQLTKTP